MTAIQSGRSVTSTVNTESIKDKVLKLMAGPEPKLTVRSILDDLQKQRAIKTIRTSDHCITESNYNPLADQTDAVKVIQRGLIKLGLIQVNTKEKFWWKKPSVLSTDESGGVAWGEYGPRTTKAVFKLQKLANLYDGEDGKVFGKRTLEALELALKEIDAGHDWKKSLSKLNN